MAPLLRDVRLTSLSNSSKVSFSSQACEAQSQDSGEREARVSWQSEEKTVLQVASGNPGPFFGNPHPNLSVGQRFASPESIVMDKAVRTQNTRERVHAEKLILAVGGIRTSWWR
jgi:hypothetical protein